MSDTLLGSGMMYVMQDRWCLFVLGPKTILERGLGRLVPAVAYPFYPNWLATTYFWAQMYVIQTVIQGCWCLFVGNSEVWVSPSRIGPNLPCCGVHRSGPSLNRLDRFAWRDGRFCSNICKYGT